MQDIHTILVSNDSAKQTEHIILHHQHLVLPKKNATVCSIFLQSVAECQQLALSRIFEHYLSAHHHHQVNLFFGDNFGSFSQFSSAVLPTFYYSTYI